MNAPKVPKEILTNIFAFPPNRETLGGTAYFIHNPTGNILVDCPMWDEPYQGFVRQLGGVRWLILTHRGGMSQNIATIQAFFQCEVVIQEQEAYLLPDVSLTSFEQEISLTSSVTLIWTPGHSPGACCVYLPQQGGILLSGRHLLPNQLGHPVPLRTAKTFHWWRQLESIQQLRDRFSSQTLNFILPGANTGFLRGKGKIDQAYAHLCALDLVKLRQSFSDSVF